MNVNTALYRFLTLLLASNMMSFAWPLRGQFGGPQGATICGAMAAVIVSVLIPWKNFRQAFAPAVVFGVLGFLAGGQNIPYGAIVDYILTQPNLGAVIPELLTILFIGASWGCIGCTYLGYGISEKSMTVWDYVIVIVMGIIAVVAAMILGTHTAYFIIFSIWIILLHLYNSLFKHSNTIWTLGLYGLISFGLGFLGAVIILFWGNHGLLPGPSGWWTLRDQMWGAAGGLGVALASWKIVSNNWQPAGISAVGFQRFGYSAFVPIVCGINLIDVFIKWFFSSPQAPNLLLAGIFIAAGAIVVIVALIYYLTTVSANFLSPANRPVLLWSFVCFSSFLRFFAIAKSIVYSGWGVWETGFSIFIFEAMMLFLIMPFIALGQENP